MGERPPVVLKRVPGKDGNPAFSFYVQQHRPWTCLRIIGAQI
jgi:hypothetical protein